MKTSSRFMHGSQNRRLCPVLRGFSRFSRFGRFGHLGRLISLCHDISPLTRFERPPRLIRYRFGSREGQLVLIKQPVLWLNYWPVRLC